MYKNIILGFTLVMFLFSLSFQVSKLSALTEEEFISYVKSLEQYRSLRGQKETPIFSEEDYRKAFRGENQAKLVAYGSKGEQMAMGLSIMKNPAQKVWSLVVDRNHYDDYFKMLNEAVIIKKDGTTFSAFHYAKPPFPFVSARQWVIDCKPNANIYKESSGKIWEYYWASNANQKGLIAQGVEQGLITKVSQKDTKNAVTSPKNLGAWILIPLPDGRTLAEVTILSDPGGSVPKAVIEWLSKSQALSMIESIDEVLNKKWDSDFSKSQEQIVTPDGKISTPGQLASK